MSLEQASSRKEQLNAQVLLRRHEERRRALAEKARSLKLLWDGYLPKSLTAEFESASFSVREEGRRES
jgi:hypothetical protein